MMQSPSKMLPLYESKKSATTIPKKEVTETVVVKCYSSDDRNSIIDIISKGLLESAKSKKEKRSTQEYLDQALLRDLDKIESLSNKLPYNRKFWVAYKGDEVLGCVGIKPTMCRKLTDKTNVTLYNLSVSKEHRKQGVGRALMKTAETHCQQQGIENIRLTTQSNLESALAFYQALGYQQTDKKKWKNLHLVYFNKEIKQPTPDSQRTIAAKKANKI